MSMTETTTAGSTGGADDSFCKGEPGSYMLDEEGMPYEGIPDLGYIRSLIADAPPPCDAFEEPDDIPIPHSSDAVPTPPAPEAWGQLATAVGFILPQVPQPPEVFTECGSLPDDTMVVCSEADPPPPLPVDEDLIVLAGATKGDIGSAAPGILQEISVVFDGDGDPGTGWVPDPAFPNDFFTEADRWYVAKHDGQGTWTLEVSDADGTTATPVTSSARLVIFGGAYMWLIPAKEFASSCPPGWRTTVFGHEGDYGLQPPNWWTGDVEPPVSAPMPFFTTRCQ